MADGGGLFGFGGRDVGRIRRMLRWFESSLGGGVGQPTGPTILQPQVFRAKVTTAIPTGTYDSPSSAGRVLIRRGPNGSRVDDPAAVALWNDYPLTASIPVGRTVRICKIGSEYWLLTTACS